MAFIADDADAEMDFAGMRAWARGDRVEARLELFEHRDEFFPVGEIGGVVDDQIDQVAAPAEVVVGLFIVGRDERAEEGRAASGLPLLEDRLVERADVVVVDEGVAQ